MNSLDDRAGCLAECLETLNHSLMELTAVFRVKRKVLAAGDMEGLLELLEREEKVVEAIFDTESRREMLSQELAEATGAASERLAQIAESLTPGARDTLFDCGVRLKTTVEALLREARIVAMICHAAVEHYEKLIHIITGTGLDCSLYSGDGQRKTPSAGRSIIDQAV